MWNRNFSLVIIFIISNVFSFRVLPWNHGISSLVYPLCAVADIEQFTWPALYLFTRTYPRDYVNNITRIRNLCSGCYRCWVEYLKRFRMMCLRIKTSAGNGINRFSSFPPKLILINFRDLLPWLCYTNFTGFSFLLSKKVVPVAYLRGRLTSLLEANIVSFAN